MLIEPYYEKKFNQWWPTIPSTYNQISSQIIEGKKIKTFDVGNLDQSLGQTHKGGVVKPVNGIQPSILDNWISNGNTDTNDRKP